MNEFKGTPGPWNVQFGDEVFAGDGIDNNQVATVNDCYDAQLIATAPELLELVMHVRNCVENDGIYEPANVDYFNKIIAKALGETK